MDTNNYNILLNILTNSTQDNKDFILVNLYFTLLSLNGYSYNEEVINKEELLVEDFLRKVNNLKVKIQLKRKPEEIDKLINDITTIYEASKNTIDKYNLKDIDIIGIINSKEPTKITNIIDLGTKETLSMKNNKDYFIKLRNTISESIKNNSYYLDNDNIILNNETTITLEEFYKVLSYLLNINAYTNRFLTAAPNELHKSLIKSIIDTINDSKELSNEIIMSIILTNIINANNNYINEIDASNFKIENIKITDLYKEADNKDINKDLSPKWRNVAISNNYLYNKLKTIINKGTYYFNSESAIFENIESSTSDFKLSITKDNLISFLKANLEYLTKQE